MSAAQGSVFSVMTIHVGGMDVKARSETTY